MRLISTLEVLRHSDTGREWTKVQNCSHTGR